MYQTYLISGNFAPPFCTVRRPLRRPNIDCGITFSTNRATPSILLPRSHAGIPRGPTLITTSITSSVTWLRVRLPAVSRPDAPGRCARCGAQSRRVRVSVCRPGSGLERKVSTVEIVSEEVARPPRLFLTYSFHARWGANPISTRHMLTFNMCHVLIGHCMVAERPPADMGRHTRKACACSRMQQEQCSQRRRSGHSEEPKAAGCSRDMQITIHKHMRRGAECGVLGVLWKEARGALPRPPRPCSCRDNL